MYEFAASLSQRLGVDAHVKSEQSISFPKAVPLTVLFGALGSDLCDAWRSGRCGECRLVLRAVEEYMSAHQDSEEVQNVLATGFLEGVWHSLMEDERAIVFDSMGYQSRKYIRAWDRFWGIDPPGGDP
jgi:hypothetical protein